MTSDDSSNPGSGPDKKSAQSAKRSLIFLALAILAAIIAGHFWIG